MGGQEVYARRNESRGGAGQARVGRKPAPDVKRDTVLYMAVLAAASFLAPLHTAPVLWAAVMQSYVIEEWAHHGTHFPTVYGLRGPYWRYIVRHHAYHHSPRGTEIAFGLTSGGWDAVLGTRVPVRDRERLYR